MIRRRWMKYGILAGLGTILVGAGGVAFAKGKGGHCGWGRGGFSAEDRKKMMSAHIDEVLDELDVTDDQRKQLHSTRDKLFAAFEENRPGRGEKLEKITALFEKDTLDVRELDALKAEHRDKMQKMEEAVSQAIVEVHATLTPEQRKELVVKAEKFRRWKRRD